VLIKGRTPRHIKAERNPGLDLVDILAARPGRSREFILHFDFIDHEFIVDPEHVSIIPSFILEGKFEYNSSMASRPEAQHPDSALSDNREEIRSLEAVVDRITYSNEDNGWCVIRLRQKGGKQITATGTLAGVHEGDRLRLRGRWVQHPRYGEQLEVESFLEVLPSTLEGIRQFLASGRIKGIGPVMARRLVNAFGLESLDVIEHQPKRLLEIQGIGAATAQKISSSWARHRGIQNIIIFLASHGVAPYIAVRLHRRYGQSTLSVVRENPYRLAEEVYGVGFLTADRIARKLGLPADAPERLMAGIIHTLTLASRNGHLFLPQSQCLQEAGDLLDIHDQGMLEEALDALRRENLVIFRPWKDDEIAVYQSRFDRAESRVAGGIARLLEHAPDSRIKEQPTPEIAEFEERHEIRLAPEQRQALQWALESPVTIVTGGPGTGKTTLIKGLVEIHSRHSREVALAAPTGRAAKRMEEATDHTAKTLHRLLEYNPIENSWGRNADTPLKLDCLVVDEVSMLDIELAARLIDALPMDSQLVLVGDSDQLPSVGPGDVLAELIRSERIPVCRLKHIFRQGQGSLIAENAHRINRGLMPRYRENSGEISDFYFAIREDPSEALETAVALVAERIPSRFGLDPIEDIQLLAPMHRGELGVQNLNSLLQEKLAPPAAAEIRLGGRVFRNGDKIMQLRNNYELEIYNGDIGRILSVDVEERELMAEFSGRQIRMESDDLEDLTPAYACTIHKAQGSEYPAVVIVLHTQHHIMLQRNLLYTAVTRGKSLVVIVGSRRALARAVANAELRSRYTLLARRLGEAQSKLP